MNENLDETDRPLTEEERRNNLKELLGEGKANEVFENAYVLAERGGAAMPTSSDPVSAGIINWKIVGIFLVIFALVMIGTAYVTSQTVQEVTVDPANVTVEGERLSEPQLP